MPSSKLEKLLQPIVQEYGLSSVLKALGKMASENETHSPTLAVNRRGEHTELKNARKRRSKPTASEYAAKMELTPDKKSSVCALAERFERKDFLPTLGDIRNFCDMYGIDVPASKTRSSAIPRVFKFLANEMEADEVQRILDYELFSGPSRLGPIADAIRRNGRASRASRLAK